MIRRNGFPHVLYRLWAIGMAASHLEVITRRSRTRFTWLWPCGMKSKGGIHLKRLCCICKCVVYVYAFLYVLSVKLTLSTCVWRWSCTRYTWANDVVVGGSGEA